jgi:hypothetical protein
MNQNPEQLSRDKIDNQLIACGWIIQNKSNINLAAGLGIAVRDIKPMLVLQIIFSLLIKNLLLLLKRNVKKKVCI